MSFSIVQQAITGSGSTQTFTNFPITGNLIVCFVIYDEQKEPVNVSGGGVSTWIPVNSGEGASISNGYYNHCYWGIVDNITPNKTVTGSGMTGSEFALGLFEISGENASSAHDQDIFVSKGSISTTQEASVTTIFDHDMVILYLAGAQGPSSYTVNSGFTITPNSGSENSAYFYSLDVGLAGTYTPGWVVPTAAEYGIAGVALRLDVPTLPPTSRMQAGFQPQTKISGVMVGPTIQIVTTED